MAKRELLGALLLSCCFASTALGVNAHPSNTPVTPTPVPPEYDPELSYDLELDPADPMAGDAFLLNFRVDLVRGVGGLPQYRLIGPGLEVLSDSAVSHSAFGQEVSFLVRAARAETHFVRLSVSYEFGVPITDGSCCIWSFRDDRSAEFEVDVGGVDAAATPSPTLTPTGPTPTPTNTAEPATPTPTPMGAHRIDVRVGSGIGCSGSRPGIALVLAPLGLPAVSDRDGSAVFAGIVDGHYTLRASPPCRSAWCWPDVPVKVSGVNVQVDFCLPACSDSVILTPESGAPGTTVAIEGACYYIHSGGQATLNFGPVPLGQVVGDTGGSYRQLFVVPHLPDGVYEVEAAGGVASFTVIDSVNVCAGDCDGNRRVVVAELVRGVGISLGTVAPDSCPVFANGAAVSDLVRAVRSSLDGCPGVP